MPSAGAGDGFRAALRLRTVFTARDENSAAFSDEPGTAVMSIPSRETPEFDNYIAALRLVFRGESWERIEGYAARAWSDCGLAESANWAEVVEDVRAAFLAG